MSLTNVDYCSPKDPPPPLGHTSLVHLQPHPVFSASPLHALPSVAHNGALTCDMQTGTVKAIKPGYGFIARDNGKDIFFHNSELRDARISTGTKVQFSVQPGAKGPVAVEVMPVTNSTSPQVCDCL